MQPFGTSSSGALRLYDDFLSHIPSRKRPPLSEVRSLAYKGRFYRDDDETLLLVRKTIPTLATDPGTPSGHAARLLNDEPTRISISLLMRPWIMQACHANASCHLRVARTLSMPRRYYWWIGTNIGTRWWLQHCLQCQACKSSRQTARWPILSLPVPSGPGIAISVDYLAHTFAARTCLLYTSPSPRD